MTLATAHDASQPGDGADPVVDTNILVAANLRAIRRHRGLTQSQVADRLAELTGRRLPDASISQMESGGYPSGRRRRFDAHDLVLLGQVLDVPVVYFFLPRPTADDAHERLRGLLGTSDNLDLVDQRLTALASSTTGDAVATLAALDGATGSQHRPDTVRYHQWRRQRLEAIEYAMRDRADELADILSNLATAIWQAGPDGFLSDLQPRSAEAEHDQKSSHS